MGWDGIGGEEEERSEWTLREKETGKTKEAYTVIEKKTEGSTEEGVE